MRIEITAQGKKNLSDMQYEYKELIEERKAEKKRLFKRLNDNFKKKKQRERLEKLRLNNNNSKNKSFSRSITKSPPKLIISPKNSKHQSKIIHTNSNTNISANEILVTEQNYLNIEERNVKQKKIQIPKSIQEKYNSSKDIFEDSIIMPTLPPDLTQGKKVYNKDGTKKDFINVKDILNENTITKLKQQKLKAKRVKELNTVINSNTFRTNYAEKNVLDELYEKLDVDLDMNKINLIKYLHSKEQVSEKFIKQFESFSDEKLNKLNKICQIITYKDEIQKMDKDIIQDKLKMNKETIQKFCKNTLNEIENSVNFSQAILKTYKNKPNKKAAYIDIHRETVKHWGIINADKLQRTKYNMFIGETSPNSGDSTKTNGFGLTKKFMSTGIDKFGFGKNTPSNSHRFNTTGYSGSSVHGLNSLKK